MVDPVTVGSLVAETLSMAAEAVLKGADGEAVKDGFIALKEKVSPRASSDVGALEETPGSVDRQTAIAKIINAQSEGDQKALLVLAEALVTELKECAPKIGLDIGRLKTLAAELLNLTDTAGNAGGDGDPAAGAEDAPKGAEKGTAEDDLAARAKQLVALEAFRKILKDLVSKSTEGFESKSPPKSTRNPFVKLRMWFQQPGFEDTAAKYASMLSILETDGWRYSETALIGITALQSRQIEIAKDVYKEVRFQTTASAALGYLMKGVGGIVVCLIALIAIVAVILVVAILIGHADGKTIFEYFVNNLLNSILAFLFGCLGGVVSVLSRLTEFDERQVRSQESLFWHGFTLPIVGGTFAAVLAAVLDAKIISILENRPQLFIVIGFLAGYSERFARNILQLAQDKFFGKDTQGQAQQ